jgi:predicted DCC family thiol-disulfide oxidoreductase YuxK
MIRVAHPPAKPRLIFDGDCGFCRRWIERWKRKTGDRVEYIAFQELGDRFPEISRERCKQSVQLIEPDGSVYEGAEAVFRSLGRQWMYRAPGVGPLSEWLYRLVARHRQWFSKLTPVRQDYALTRSVFIRFLGVIYLCAFVSLWTQITGLIGSHGIAPITYLMGEHATANFNHNGIGAYWLMPTVFWFGHSDATLHFVCGLGTALAVLVVAGVATMPALAGLWVLYLSLSVVCGLFLGYQWDALLLEVGFLAIWFAPWGWRPSALRTTEPPRLVLWMFWWLLFRLMLASGAVKLASGDLTWHALTALTVHYETQPLPTWIGWYAHQLPAWFQKTSCAIMFGIELGLPFFIWLGRRARQVACAGFVFLMALISLTGNYCFFNLLTVALCVLLLDDRALCWLLGLKPVVGARPLQWRNWLFAPVALAILIATVPALFRSCGVRVRWPRPVLRAYYTLHQNLGVFRSVNSYGLFAVMTASRPEIILEGSADGVEWKPYEFRYKPGDVSRRPRFCWPHQPRVDWQMWFAALGSYDNNPWLINFCVRLLQNEPAVTRLLAHNPFPDRPPRYIRAVVYEYRFTSFAERRATGHWWKREPKGLYCPVLTTQ